MKGRHFFKRDHLRANAEERTQYGALKLLLELDNKTGIAEYLRGKAPLRNDL